MFPRPAFNIFSRADAHLMRSVILVYRARRYEARIQQMLWKVNYADITFINTVCVTLSSVLLLVLMRFRTFDTLISMLIFYSSVLARYVPNVAKRSIWDQCKKYEYWRPTDRPQGTFTHFAKISNGHNCATRQPTPSMFGSRVGFSGTADRTAPFPVGSNPRWRPSWQTSNGYVSATHYPIHCMYVHRPYFALDL